MNTLIKLNYKPGFDFLLLREATSSFSTSMSESMSETNELYLTWDTWLMFIFAIFCY